MDKRTILLAENLAYELPSTRTLFHSVRVGIEAGDRIALVGPNGSGKSTLLKILAGQISPSRGSVWRHGSIYYLPQISTVKQDIEAYTVLDLLSSVSEEWWKIEDILEAKFSTPLDLSLPVAQLSGGELTKLFLAIGLSQEPNLLLLDEPTNHMDLQALESLKNCLDDFDGAFVIVSHKPFFLDQVAEITWELTPKGINVYGGNFSLYREQKETELEAILRSHEVAKKDLKRARDAAQKEQERSARSKREGRLQAFDNSMGKAAKRYFENRASASAGNAAKKHQVAVEQALQKVTETKVRTTKATCIQLEERSQKRRNLIEIQGANLWVADRLLIKNIQLHLSTGDRVAIAGHNGSGKSSLAKAILGRDDGTALLESGEILITPEIKAVYLDQTYELIDRDQTILENMQAANPDLEYQLLRQQLGHFLFFNDDVRKPASVLSGGELARLALAIISISEIDLLILDEPTNNLDITTVNQMVEGINKYHGALWVISHDLDFLSKINITQGFKLQDKSLQMTAYLPHETEQYYLELLH